MKSRKSWRRLAAVLVKERNRAGLSQRELARKLGRSQAWVSRVEAGLAPVEIIEFLTIARAIGFDPLEALRKISKDLEG